MGRGVRTYSSMRKTRPHPRRWEWDQPPPRRTPLVYNHMDSIKKLGLTMVALTAMGMTALAGCGGGEGGDDDEGGAPNAAQQEDGDDD